MAARMMPIVAITLVAFCFSDVASAADGGRSPYTQTPTQRTATWSRFAKAAKTPLHTISWKQKAARRLPADGDPYADSAAPYKANRLSSRPAQPIINIPWANNRPHEAGYRRQERHDPEGRLAYNPGRDDWKITAPLPHPVAFDLVALPSIQIGGDGAAKTLAITPSLLASRRGDRIRGYVRPGADFSDLM